MRVKELLVSENLLEKAALFVVGCCTIGSTAAATASGLLQPGVALGGVLGAVALKAVLKTEPEHLRALQSVRRKMRRKYLLSGEISGEELGRLTSALAAAIDQDNLFSLESLKRALSVDGEIGAALVELSVQAISKEHPQFRQPGLWRDFAVELLEDAFEHALRECHNFRSQLIYAASAENLRIAREASKKIDVLDEKLSLITDPEASLSAESEWDKYGNYLRGLFSADVPGENIALRDLYVPLRARYPTDAIVVRHKEKRRRRQRRQSRPAGEQRLVGVTGFKADDAATLLGEWLRRDNVGDDSIRLVRGGPGSGKSTLAKFLCDKLTRDAAAPEIVIKYRVIYIPLQHIHIDEISSIRELDEYLVATGYFSCGPLGQFPTASDNYRLLLIVDGLDEISRHTRDSVDKSGKFVRILRSWLASKNVVSTKAVCLIIGRDAAIEWASVELLLAPHQTLYLMPYGLLESVNEQGTATLHVDQRALWWDRWRSQKEGMPHALPRVYLEGLLSEISVEPLLLYMLSRERVYENAEGFCTAKDVYDLILSKVLSDWHNRPMSSDIQAAPIFRLLEIIGAAAWSNNGRMTSASEVEAYCANDQTLFVEFRSILDRKSLSQAVLSFYFDVKSSWDDLGIEFVHKSFADYLAAKFVIRTVREIVECGQPALEGAKAWLRSFRGAILTPEIGQFVLGEFRSWETNYRLVVSEYFEQLLNALIECEPDQIHELAPGMGIAGALQSVFFVMGACQDGNSLRNIQWIEREDASRILDLCLAGSNAARWHWRVAGRCYVPTDPDIFLGWLKNLNFSEQFLHNRRFARVNFSGSSFVEATMSASIFTDCILSGANFSGADLQGSSWNGTNISAVNFGGADLRGADLRLANGFSPKQFDTARTDRTTQFPDAILRGLAARARVSR